MRALLIVIVASLAPCIARAQGSYEIEVYNTEITPVRSLMLELHSNYTFRGREISNAPNAPPLIDDSWHWGDSQLLSAATGCTAPTKPFFQLGTAAHVSASSARAAATSTACALAQATNAYATHETIEAATGLTDWAEIGAYLFTSEQSSPGVQITGGSIRSKIRVPVDWNWPVGVALSTELEYDSPQYSADTWTWEIRPVIEKAIGRWYLSVNPTLERTLLGAGVVNGLQFSPSAKATFDITDLVSGGVEYYGAYGRIGGFAPPASRLQQFFGVADVHVSPLWEINCGLGTGTTPATSHLVAKLILGRRFSW